MNIKSLGHLLIPFCIASLVLCVGCERDSVSKSTVKKEPPKLSFHKPRSFRLAVERIREVHDLLVADGEMPKPISYTVVEVSHAHAGGKSHVHYDLVDSSRVEDCDCEEGHDHDHEHGTDGHNHEHGDAKGHSHKDPFAVKHTIVVDAFTELKDIIRWLPAIASDSDMPAEQWSQVKAVSDKMTGLLEKATSKEIETGQRADYKSQQEAIASVISELEILLKPNAAKIL